MGHKIRNILHNPILYDTGFLLVRRKPVEKPTLRMEVSPSLEETKGWTLKDWYDYAIRFLEEFKKEVQAQEGKKKGKGKFNLDRAQIFACLHFDAKSSIPHLHILINRIDLDGNLMDDSFIGEKAVKAAHAINVERGWELPEDIHDAHIKEITEACYYILHGMARYDGTLIYTVLKVVATKSRNNVTNKVCSMGTPCFVVTLVSSHRYWAKVVT